MSAFNFPPSVDASDFIKQSETPPLELIKGILHQGCKAMLGGASKTNKTWILADMALSISHGHNWLGIPTSQAPVTYLNMELKPYFFRQRLIEIAKAKKIQIDPQRLRIWNLRGYVSGYKSFLVSIKDQFLKGNKPSLFIVDPIYMILGEAVENSAEEIGGMMNQLEEVCSQTGSATAFAHHFTKGNPSSKESIDRVSGSGVFARNPDSIITITRHEDNDCYVVEFTLRNSAPIKPFGVRWKHPLMERDDNIDPSKLRGEKNGVGRPEVHEAESLLGYLPSSGATTAEWHRASESACGIAESTFYKKIKLLKDDGLIETQNNRWKKVSTGELIERFKNASKS